MNWSVLIACALVVVAILGIVAGIVRAATGRDRAHRPDDEGEFGDSVASGMLGDLVEIFQPSRVHLTEEMERRRMDIAQRPAEGGPFDVDLDAGTVTLRPDEDPGPPS